jgi:hypothetical protein
MKYYVMVGEGPYPAWPIIEEPELSSDYPWYTGKVVAYEVDSPMVYELDDPGGYYDEEDECKEPLNLKSLYDGEAFPVMSNDLFEALKAAGVDNLQVFPAHLKESDTGTLHTDYWAFNVLGLISAADMEASTLMPHAKPGSLDIHFDSLVIDESKTHGQHLFRLAENCSAIMVSEQVRDEVERCGIPGVVFYNPEHWAG